MNRRQAFSLQLATLLALLVMGGCGFEDTRLLTPAPGVPGAPDSPITLTVAAASTRSIPGRHIIYYRFTASATSHTIALQKVDSDVSWELYSDATSFATQLSFCDEFFDTRDESCRAQGLSASTTYGLTVTEWDDVDNTLDILISTL